MVWHCPASRKTSIADKNISKTVTLSDSARGTSEEESKGPDSVSSAMLIQGVLPGNPPTKIQRPGLQNISKEERTQLLVAREDLSLIPFFSAEPTPSLYMTQAAHEQRYFACVSSLRN
jgi:hypothetical protein